MDNETIILNECRNAQPVIHLYYSQTAEIWQAFGMSAYCLDEFATHNDIPHLLGYSCRLMMPAVALPDTELKKFSIKPLTSAFGPQDHVVLSISDAPNKNDYIAWARKLYNDTHVAKQSD